MAQSRAHQNSAPRESTPPLTRESAERLLPPGLEVAAPLLEALSGRLDRYLHMLLAWNRAINLTGGRTRADILVRLIPDSFELAAFLESAPLAQIPAMTGAPRVWDLGAGAGLPGIPLRMVWDRGDYTLVEPREKRALFLANALAQLDLPRTTVFRGTAEALFAHEPHGADIILSRAFMPWEKLLPFCEPGLAPGGLVIIFALEAGGEIPAPWRLCAEWAYSVGENRRWFWALRNGEAARA
ncbi:MAG: 16S rRNA (guanine(527)-N(7))-methyltransferase RsmG [Desulfovibrio sp.]|nr:16S rRNA (guanine(527)-N(7))-methyltransferase RsmG [Desulfovibrio sp.]